MTDAIVASIADHYRELYHQMTGAPLTPLASPNILERIERNIVNYLN
jgi:hypothetical protein